MFKKALSVFMAVIFAFSAVAVVPASATVVPVTGVNTTTTNDVKVNGTDSLGNMFAEEYEQTDEDLEENGNNIYAIEVEEKTVYVELQALADAKLIVALYDEQGQAMYCTATKDITTEDTVVELNLDIATMPQYYIVKAYMVKPETNIPMCKQYECDTYTQAMQEFLSKTTADFPQEQVLNLDENADNNFMVYNENIILIESDGETNTVASVDDETGTYVIENIDESISSFKSGDIFSQTYGDANNLLIVKINTITIDGTTATITGDETAMEEVFDYIKIDTAQEAGEATVDTSTLDEGVEYLGKTENDTPSTVSDKGVYSTGGKLVDKESTLKSSLEFELDKEIGSSTISGSLSCGLEATLKCYYDAKLFKKDEVKFSLKVNYESKLTLSLKIEIPETEIPLCGVAFSPVPGISIALIPSVVFEGEVNVELTGTLSGQVGKEFKNGKFKNLNKEPAFKSEFKVEGKLFVGISLEPTIRIAGNVVTAKMEAKSGVEISAEMEFSSDEDDADEKHACKNCIDGAIDWVMEISFTLKLVDSKKLSWKAVALEEKVFLLDFYYSFDTNKFAFTTCPNNVYKQTVTILDGDKNPVKDADVNGILTNTRGKAIIYLKKGKQEIKVKKDDLIKTQKIYVTGKGNKTITLWNINANDNENNEGNEDTPKDNTIVDSLQPTISYTGKCGKNVYYSLYSDGTLKITGAGAMEDYSKEKTPWNSKRSAIKKVIIYNGVTTIGTYAFYYCSYLTNVTFGNSVTTIGYSAFKDCRSIKNLTIPNSVNYIGQSAFENCKYLTNVKIGNGVTTIARNAFYNCESLTNVTMGDSVTTIGEDAFRACSSLASIKIPQSVVTIECGAFGYCKSLTNIDVSPNNSDFVSIEGVLFNKACTTLIQYPVANPNTTYIVPDSVTVIGEYAFAYCEALKNITLPNSLTTICYASFHSCTYLTDVMLPDSVTEIGGFAFYGCYNIKSMVIPYGVTSINSGTFENCGINSVTIPESVTSIGMQAFESSGLQSINIPGSVTSIGGSAFDNCNGLTSIIIPEGVTSIGSSAFYGCWNLGSIEIAKSVVAIGSSSFINTAYYRNGNNWDNGVLYIGTSLIEAKDTVSGEYIIKEGTTCVAQNAFGFCEGLTSLVFPDSVTCISDSAFLGNDNLINITLGKGVTSIGERAFSQCSGLKSITIPYGVTKIGMDAFYFCGNLSDVYYTGSESDWANIQIVGLKYGNEDLRTATIHYNSSGPATVDLDMATAEILVDATILHTSVSDVTEVPSLPLITYTRSNLTPGSEAVLMVIEGATDDYIVDSSTILYITQTTVDETGTATLTAYGDFSSSYWVACIFGDCSHSNTHTETVTEPCTFESGLEITICDNCGEIIESTELPAIYPNGKLGDTTMDGKITISDATAIQKQLAQMITFNDQQTAAADVNGDGIVDINDVTTIQKYLAKFITSFTS